MAGWDVTELSRATSATGLVKAMDTVKFLESFVVAVLPILRPYPQPNSVRRNDYQAWLLLGSAWLCSCGAARSCCSQVLICDNATLHHDEMRWLERLVESAGAIIIFLPPYACDLNPIEKGFGRVKQLIQDNAEEASYNPRKVLDDAFRTVGPELAISYYQDMHRILDEC